MGYHIAQKELTLVAEGGALIFSLGKTSQDLIKDHAHNIIDIICLDGPDGDPVSPTAGMFTVFVERVANGGFHSISDGGVILAPETGGTTVADGSVTGASYSSNSNRVKIVAIDVDVATHVQVTITQNLT